MPLVTETQPDRIQSLPEQPEIIEGGPDTGDVFQAAFRQENSLVSWAANSFSVNDFQPEEGFDPYQPENLQGYEMWAENFIEAALMVVIFPINRGGRRKFASQRVQRVGVAAVFFSKPLGLGFLGGFAHFRFLVCL